MLASKLLGCYAFYRKHKAACGGETAANGGKAMALSYSLHLSAKGHALTTIGKVAQASRHNLRAYKSTVYSQSGITVLRGSGSILADVRQIYNDEFSGAIAEYNTGKRPDRQIGDYLRHASDSATTDIAVELILQIGDSDFWRAQPAASRQAMVTVFQQQLEDLQDQVPELRIASAVVHDDEASPHMHVVAVPVAEYGRGLRKRVSKTKVFTKERLAKLQTEMREAAEREVQDVFPDEKIASKAEGRNRDIPKRSLAELREVEITTREAAESLQKAREELQTVLLAQEQVETTIEVLRAEKQATETDLKKYSMELPDDYEVNRSHALDTLLDWIPTPFATRIQQGLDWILDKHRKTGLWPRRRPGAARQWPGSDRGPTPLSRE
jgi:hypothetical protein